MAVAIVYLAIGLLMHMIALSRAQDQEEPTFECTFDDNLLSADGSHFGTVDPSDAFKWKNGRIPYFWKGRVTSNDKRVFYRAMKQIEERTCLRFEENRREPREHHLEISVGSTSCTARGFSAGVAVQSFRKVTLQSSYQLADSPRCNWQGGILHELMHVLGIMHTQKRKDRDQHIRINWNNVARGAGARYQYSTCEGCNNYGVGYDCASIMHYGTSTFGNGRGPTMVARNSRSCKLTSAGSAFDGRGASQSDWDLVQKVANTVCSGSPKPTERPTRPTQRPTEAPTPTLSPTGTTKPTTQSPPSDGDCITDGGPAEGSPCVFPFRFLGWTYHECTWDFTPNGHAWCSTKTDGSGAHIGGQGNWGTCPRSCPGGTFDWGFNEYGQSNQVSFNEHSLEQSNSVVL